MQIKINVCPKFLTKDIKSLRKDLKYKMFFALEDISSMDYNSQIDSIPFAQAVKNTIFNTLQCGTIPPGTDLCDRQPLLIHGWRIYKMRYAIDKKGKRDGARIIFCVNDLDSNNVQLLLVFVATKSQSANQRELENEYLSRIKEFIGI